jgi:hypothetical protein
VSRLFKAVGRFGSTSSRRRKRVGVIKIGFYASNGLLIPYVGVFAGEKIEAGTFLGIYSGELITEAIGESRRYVDLAGAVVYCADDW